MKIFMESFDLRKSPKDLKNHKIFSEDCLQYFYLQRIQKLKNIQI